MRIFTYALIRIFTYKIDHFEVLLLPVFLKRTVISEPILTWSFNHVFGIIFGSIVNLRTASSLYSFSSFFQVAGKPCYGAGTQINLVRL